MKQLTHPEYVEAMRKFVEWCWEWEVSGGITAQAIFIKLSELGLVTEDQAISGDHAEFNLEYVPPPDATAHNEQVDKLWAFKDELYAAALALNDGAVNSKWIMNLLGDKGLVVVDEKGRFSFAPRIDAPDCGAAVINRDPDICCERAVKEFIDKTMIIDKVLNPAEREAAAVRKALDRVFYMLCDEFGPAMIPVVDVGNALSAEIAKLGKE